MSEKIETNFVYRFSGLILRVGRERFIARLIDLTNPTNPDIECEYQLSEVSKYELERVFAGNSFTMVVTQTYEDGRMVSTKNFYFRSVEYWTKQEIDEIKEEARKLHESIEWE